jgi:hypothetical protein
VYTQYTDDLFFVANTGAYAFSTEYGCPFRPWAIQAQYLSTLGSPLGSQNNFTGLMDTGVVVTPFGPNYFGDILTKAGPDVTETNYNMEDSWHIWTNQPVTLTVTGNELIKMDMTGMNRPGLTQVDANDWAIEHTLQISDNLTSGYVKFYNQIANEGSTFQSGIAYYDDRFYVDVRWIDQTGTTILTSTVADIGMKTVTLSGQT